VPDIFTGMCTITGPKSNLWTGLSLPKIHIQSAQYIGETFAKRPFLPDFCACPVAPEDGTGVRLNILHEVEL